MLSKSPERSSLVAIIVGLALCIAVRAQAPSSVQFFMPDGSLPPNELRFSMVSEDGRIVDTFYTDSKGRFLFTRAQGLRSDIGYTITVQSDGRTYDTTTVSFKYYANTVFYVPIFLRPLTHKTPKPAEVVDLAELDPVAPKEAREAYDGAMNALRTGRAEEAVTKLRNALAIYPDYFRALNDLGVLLMKLNRLEEAAEALERAMKVAPRVYYARLNLGVVRTRQGRYKEAISLLEALHKQNPTLTEVRVPLADALMAVDRLDAAEAHLRAALADPKLAGVSSGDVHYKLGLLLNRKQRFEEAVSELKLAVGLLPESPRAHLQLGGALLQLNRLEEAERALLASYRLGGAEMGGAQLFLGQLYFAQKKYEQAMHAFERYLADVPSAPNAAEVRDVIAKIKAAIRPN
jgi:Flp pilus assembly protein TadD